MASLFILGVLSLTRSAVSGFVPFLAEMAHQSSNRTGSAVSANFGLIDIAKYGSKWFLNVPVLACE